MGRKPLAEEPKTDRPLRIRLTDAEREQLDAEAARRGKATSAWARELLLAAATRKRSR